MTATIASQSPPSAARRRPLLVAAVASLSAGAIHAAAIGSHAEHRQAAIAFTAVAGFQIAWGAAALARPGKRMAYVGAVGNAALFAGWVLAKTKGINFIDGLEDVEPVQIADGLAAGLALLSTAAAVLVYLGRALQRARPMLAGAVVMALAVSAFPGMVQAGRHVHAGHTHGQTIVVGADGQAQVVDAPAVVPPKPFDPKLPIDLGGVPGVTPEQQAAAENLLAATVLRLPQWADPAVAEAAGFRSIGDGITGDEHFINLEFMANANVLDPDEPESLVYRNVNGTRTLEAAMFMLPPGSNLDSVPNVGGALMQWHIHDNLCFTASGTVAGLTDANGNCPAPLVKPQPVPMIHVWIVPRPCGPFSALEGIGGGSVKPGETVLCDQAHGSTGF